MYNGQSKPPLINIQNIHQVPIAMFVGRKDKLADEVVNQWAHEQMKGDVKFYKEYDLGHLSFMVAKDMSYFTQDVMNVLKQHHTLLTPEFITE